MRKKAWILFSVFSLLLVGIGAHLKTITPSNTSAAGVGKASRTVTVSTVRGTIYDSRLRPLVNQHREYRAAILPEERLLTLVRSQMSYQNYTMLRNQVEKGIPAVARLTGPIPPADGMRLVFTPIRYADTVPAAHLLGYLDSSSQTGVSGIEAAYNEILSQYGGQATVSFETDGGGNYLSGKVPSVTNTLENAAGGIALTVDLDIQNAVEQATGSLEKGAVVVMDPHSGAILASASYPTFHPESIAESIQKNDGALVNRILSQFDCGSVFKIVTTAAALERGISPETTFDCAGGMTVGNTVFHCHKRLGHQTINMYEAFSSSCNLYYIQLAQMIGSEALLDTAERLGLRQAIALASGLSSPGGLLPTVNELNTPAALANLSFGQGKLLLSPLQIARLTATVANGGVLPSVYVYKGVVDADGHLTEQEPKEGERVLSYRTSQILKTMMEQVVTEGTGKSAASENTTVAGKTGTAETGQYNGGTPVVQSWFTGYFPADNPRYVITVLAEDCETTGCSAAEVFCEISNNLTKINKEAD